MKVEIEKLSEKIHEMSIENITLNDTFTKKNADLERYMCVCGPTFFFYRQLGCLAFSLRFWQKIKRILSNCPASDWTVSFKTAYFC